MADQTTTVRLENKSAHVKYISLGGGGEVITIPPTDVGTPGIEIKLESDLERAAFARALETPAVKAWIDDEELIIDGGGAKTGKGARADATPETVTRNTGAEPYEPSAPPTAASQAQHSRSPQRRTDKE